MARTRCGCCGGGRYNMMLLQNMNRGLKCLMHGQYSNLVGKSICKKEGRSSNVAFPLYRMYNYRIGARVNFLITPPIDNYSKEAQEWATTNKVPMNVKSHSIGEFYCLLEKIGADQNSTTENREVFGSTFSIMELDNGKVRGVTAFHSLCWLDSMEALNDYNVSYYATLSSKSRYAEVVREWKDADNANTVKGTLGVYGVHKVEIDEIALRARRQWIDINMKNPNEREADSFKEPDFGLVTQPMMDILFFYMPKELLNDKAVQPLKFSDTEINEGTYFGYFGFQYSFGGSKNHMHRESRVYKTYTVPLIVDMVFGVGEIKSPGQIASSYSTLNIGSSGSPCLDMYGDVLGFNISPFYEFKELAKGAATKAEANKEEDLYSFNAGIPLNEKESYRKNVYNLILTKDNEGLKFIVRAIREAGDNNILYEKKAGLLGKRPKLTEIVRKSKRIKHEQAMEQDKKLVVKINEEMTHIVIKSKSMKMGRRDTSVNRSLVR